MPELAFIRLDPAELGRAADEIEHVAEEYRGLAEQAWRAAQGAPSYDGQFGPKVWAAGDEAHARLSRMAGDLTGLGQELIGIAEAFEAAEAESVLAMQALRLNAQAFMGAGLGSLLHSLYRPPHISQELWNMLPVEDRIAILLGLGLALDAPNAPDQVLFVTNPLRVRQNPGLNGEIRAYAIPGSQVTYTGLSRTVDGIQWYLVTYKDALKGGLVIGWVSSSTSPQADRVSALSPKRCRNSSTSTRTRNYWRAGGAAR